MLVLPAPPDVAFVVIVVLLASALGAVVAFATAIVSTRSPVATAESVQFVAAFVEQEPVTAIVEKANSAHSINTVSGISRSQSFI